MRRVFAVEKFKSLLLAGSFTVLASYVVRLTDSLIAGNLLGADALAGVNLASPFLSAVSFCAGLVATGMATNYSLAMGRCDRDRARRYFMQGVWSVLALGGGLMVAAIFGREFYLGFFGASEPVTAFAREYFAWTAPVAVLEGVLMLLVSLGYADGDSILCMLGYLVVFAGNLVFSLLAVHWGFGLAGCAFGSVLAEGLGCLVLALHFLRRTNTFAPVAHFSFGDSWRIVSASFGDAAAFLCDGLLFLFLNKFVIMVFGSQWLPVLGLLAVLWGFLEVLNGVGVALQPIVTVYYGEGNVRTVRQVLASAVRWSLLEGAVLALALEAFPGLPVAMVGLEDPGLVAAAKTAVRWLGAGALALALAGLFNSYYMFVERSLLAGLVTFVGYLILPVAAVAVLSVFGIGGVWAGVGLGPVLGILISAAVIVAVAGRERFPHLLAREREAGIHVFDLRIDEREIVEVSRAISGLPGVPMRAALVTEEVLMAVKDRARGRHLLGEVTLDLNDGVQLTIRDDGEIFDITDVDQSVSSLRTYLVASMMQCQRGRMNLVTTGFNRNVFKF